MYECLGLDGRPPFDRALECYLSVVGIGKGLERRLGRGRAVCWGAVGPPQYSVAPHQRLRAATRPTEEAEEDTGHLGR